MLEGSTLGKEGSIILDHLEDTSMSSEKYLDGGGEQPKNTTASRGPRSVDCVKVGSKGGQVSPFTLQKCSGASARGKLNSMYVPSGFCAERSERH